MNKKNPTSSNRRFGALALAVTVLAGVVGYETIEFQHRKLSTPRSPLTPFVMPSFEDQSEKLLISLNESKQEVNALKRLLFQQNFAKENAKITALQTILNNKEELLTKLQNEVTDYKTKTVILESALAAVKDLVEVQTTLKEQFQKNLIDQVTRTRHETIDEAKVLVDILESQIAYTTDKANYLTEELLTERHLSFITQEIQEQELKNLSAYIEKLSQDRVRINDELMIAKMINILANRSLLSDLTYLNLMNQSLMAELEIAETHKEQAQQSKFSLTEDLSKTIESKTIAENLLHKTQSDLNTTQDHIKTLSQKTAEMQDEMQLLQLLYSYGSYRTTEKEVEIDQLQHELVKLVDTIQQTDHERVALNQSLNTLLSELAYQIDTHHSIIGSLSDDIASIQNEKQSLENEITTLKNLQSQKEQVKEDLEEQLSLSFEKQQKLEQQIASLELAFDDKSRHLQKTMESYLKEKDDLELSFQKLKMDLYAQEVINTHLAPLEHELLEKEAIYRKNVEEKDIALVESQEMVKNLQSRLLLEQHNSIQLQQELEAASNHSIYDEEHLTQLYDEIEKSKLIAAEYQNQLTLKENAWQIQLDSFEKAQNLLASDIECLKKDLVLAEDKYLKSNQENDRLTLDLEHSLTTLRQLENQIQMREQAYAATVSDLEELNQNLLIELELSRKNRVSEEERVTALNDSLTDANNALKKTEELLQSLEQKLKLIDNTLQQTSQDHQTSLKEIDRLQEILSGRVYEVLNLENQLTELNEKYYHSLNELDALSELLQGHESELEIGDLP